MKRLFLVSGMHRSGTSCVSNLLHLLGVDFGNDPALNASKSDNKYGNWENQELVSANDSLLLFKHSYWFDPFNFAPPDSLSDVPEYFSVKTSSIRSYISGLGSEAGVKDPRLSLTLPFWKEALSDYELILVYVFRKPQLVASSLASRNSFPFEYSLALWEYYLRAAADGVEDMKSISVSFDRLILDPIKICGRLARDIGLDVSRESITSAVETVIDPALCRSSKFLPEVLGEIEDLHDGLDSNGLTDIDTQMSEFALYSWRTFAPVLHSRFMQKEILFLRDRLLN